MSDEEEVETPEQEKPKPRRRRSRSDAGKPRLSRSDRRAQSAKETIQELIRLRKPDLDVEGLSFVEVVDRDADAWGKFIAFVADKVGVVGLIVDAIFGAPVMILVGLAPSVRAARRDLTERRERKQAEREAERLEDEFDRVQREGLQGE